MKMIEALTENELEESKELIKAKFRFDANSNELIGPSGAPIEFRCSFKLANGKRINFDKSRAIWFLVTGIWAKNIRTKDGIIFADGKQIDIRKKNQSHMIGSVVAGDSCLYSVIVDNKKRLVVARSISEVEKHIGKPVTFIQAVCRVELAVERNEDER